MLGSDPISALLGAGLDPRSPATVWKRYLRGLVAHGAAPVLAGPDTNPDPVQLETVSAELDIDPKQLAARLAALRSKYPVLTPMPTDTTGKLTGTGNVDTIESRVNDRVTSYLRHLAKVVGNRNALLALIQHGLITPSAGLHVGRSALVSVTALDADAMASWRAFASDRAQDRLEAHTAPTVLLPTCPGGGVMLFRVPRQQEVPWTSIRVGGCTIDTGDAVVPIPPTRIHGGPVARLGPCRPVPEWLSAILAEEESAVA